MKSIRIHLLGLLVILFLGACCQKPPIVVPRELGIFPGVWTLQTPDGKTLSVTVAEFREYEYHFRADGMPFNGVYRYRSGDLRSINPDSPRMSGYSWAKKSEREIYLSAEPPFEHTQRRLVGSRMFLQN